MTEPQLQTVAPTLRQLRHDIGNDLSIITLGLRALSGVREDAEQFSEVMEMVEQNVESLKEKMAQVMELSK